ncbi:hypothetical protein A8C56_22410 [Niabella ginsenosidivorans]|uniref:Macroglobulin domain-containing protein n=1 Tax=Niabella ginsenosidivorans TaxID=1176587 RepID=A0A1A9I9L8_9BACT|nr:hypothetical protein [Niabella ginsenosidivorans]ANH83371.1 hypothetical protein A8C56_22410 [Niabella ginsenosidivorans]
MDNRHYTFFHIRLLLFIAGAFLTIAGKGQTELPAAAVQHKITGNEEVLFIHTDKESYLAGEIIWYKVYLLNADGFTGNTYNTISYLELLNDKGSPVLQSKIEVKKGSGDGSLYLPVNISTGAYTLIGYTSRMKTGDPKLFFRKRVLVTNSLTAGEAAPAAKETTALIHFFPEGGDAIEGLITKVGVQVLDPKTTNGVQARGSIVANETDTVAKFETQKFGLGQFIYTPRSGNRYTAIVSIPGKEPVKVALPAQKISGHTISVSEENNDSYKIIVSAQRALPQKMFLVAHTGQTSKVALELEMEADNSIACRVSKSRLGTGVVYFTLFDQNWQPVSERLVFTPPDLAKAEVKINHENTAAARQQLTIELTPERISGNKQIINGSLSVFSADRNNQPVLNIRDYLYLTVHLSGKIEAPEFYFTPEAMQGSYIENLMLVNGWRRFSPTNNTGRTAVPAVPEYNGHIITARVVDTWTNKPATGVACFLTVPSVPFGLFNGTTDADGIVRFNVNRYYGPGDIFVKPFPSDNTSNTYRIEVLSPFADSTSKTFYQPPFLLNPVDSTDLLKRSIAMQANNIYYKDPLNTFHVPVYKDSLPFYDKAEVTYMLDDYKRFSTMEEVLREYVTPINVTVRDRKLKMTIYNEKSESVYRFAVLVLLDGVPLHDYNSIFNYDPFKVKRLDVVPRRFVIGPAVYSGIASFQTYDAKFDGFELDPTAVPVDYEGLELKREFFSPVYTAENKGDLRMPDYRTTLLWNPAIRLEEGNARKINCFTSDFTGTYKIVLQGITEDGKPVYSESSFTVNKQ